MNVLISDLLAAAGPVMVAGLNALPESAKQAVAQATEDGGWCELRIGMQNNAATVRVMLCNLDGHAAELVSLDHPAH